MVSAYFSSNFSHVSFANLLSSSHHFWTQSLARKLLPLANRVLVRRAEQISKTTSGIYLPESAQSKPNEAEVIAVGPGAKNAEGNTIAMSVKPGDKVLLPEYGGTAVKLGDDTFHLFRDEDILGRYED